MEKLCALFCAFGLLIGAGCQNEHHEKAEESTFKVTSPIKKDTTIFSEYVCQIHAFQRIELRSQERGYLQDIYVDEGKLVKKGQVMFQIMPSLYQAEMQKVQAEVNFAEIEFKNTKSLADSNIVSKNELALVKAKLDKAKAELSLSRIHLGFTKICAPFDGLMDRFQVRLGSLIDEGELLTTLSDNSKVWVYFNVPESEYLEYANSKNSGKQLKVKLQMANKQMFDHDGIVETIEAEFNNENGNIAFRATFPNPKGILRHGETGNIFMPIVLKEALLIPQKATFEILDKKFVFVVDENNEVKSREIIVGQEMPHLYAVVGGLNEKDKILVEGLRKVKNNQKIKYDFISQQQIISELHQLHAE